MKRLIFILLLSIALFSCKNEPTSGMYLSVKNMMGYQIYDVHYGKLGGFWYKTNKVTTLNDEDHKCIINNGDIKYTYLFGSDLGSDYIYFKCSPKGYEESFRTSDYIITYDLVDQDFILDSNTKLTTASFY
jgi:hypothetical protein